ncbi:MAG: response regulator transcription factor [Planctomycetaceae bacterium]
MNAEQPTEKKTIVLIEDDRDISTTIQSVLTAAGYRVVSASNGQDGRRLIQQQRPDLVLTDMMMPRMGGFPVLEFLAELPDAPPVIMMTACSISRTPVSAVSGVCENQLPEEPARARAMESSMTSMANGFRR